MHPRSQARFQVLGAALLFSTGGAAIKAAEFTSWQVASLRSGVAAVAVLLLSRAARQGWTWRSALVGMAYAATLILFVLANKLTTAANTIFLQSTAPLYILLLGPLLLRESVSRRDIIFMMVVGTGMALFFMGRQPTFATAPDPLKGNILAALSGLTYALMLLGLRSMGKSGGSPAAAVAAGNLIAFVVALPMALPLGAHRAVDWGVIIYLGVLQIALAYMLLSAAIPHVPALEVSLLLFVEPALNPFWAWLVQGETPGPWSLAGGALILGATAVRTLLAGRSAAEQAGVMRPAPE
jgi:drug/metabolite transporter, DME family